MTKLLITALACLLATATSAEQLTRRVAGLTAIADVSGDSRVLFKMDSPVELENIAIRRAVLRFDATGMVVDRVLTLRVHPVTTPWVAGAVTWDAGWSRPGSDYDSELFALREVDLRSPSVELRFDLTTVFKEMVEEGMVTDGFMLTVDPGEGAGIAAADVARFASLAAGTFEVTYVAMAPPPGRRGARAGLRRG
ncbi:MAG: hypothetical protein ACT4PE_16910 [Candidatus Eiseniibacteriota bacterium]